MTPTHIDNATPFQVDTFRAHFSTDSPSSHVDAILSENPREVPAREALKDLGQAFRHLSQNVDVSSMSPEEAIGPSIAPESGDDSSMSPEEAMGPSIVPDIFEDDDDAFEGRDFFDFRSRSTPARDGPNAGLMPLLLLAGVAVLGTIVVTRANYVIVRFPTRIRRLHG